MNGNIIEAKKSGPMFVGQGAPVVATMLEKLGRRIL